MGEGLRTHAASCHFLQTVIAHRRCCTKTRLNIALINDLALFSGFTPDPSEAIGLELQVHGKRVRLRRITFPQTLNLLLNAQELLNMMPDFVCDHVGLRELARRTKARS